MMVIIDRSAVDELFRDIPCEVRYEYSGRGMYGRTCLGVVVDPKHVSSVLRMNLGDRGPVTDDMGIQTIVYWTDVHVVGE